MEDLLLSRNLYIIIRQIYHKKISYAPVFQLNLCRTLFGLIFYWKNLAKVRKYHIIAVVNGRIAQPIQDNVAEAKLLGTAMHSTRLAPWISTWFCLLFFLFSLIGGFPSGKCHQFSLCRLIKEIYCRSLNEFSI